MKAELKNNLIPQLRFPEFEGEWVEKKLGDISEKIQDGTHFSPKLDANKDYKYITSKNIKQGYLDLENVDYISKEEHQKIYKRCSVKYGDVLLTKDGASTGNVCLNSLVEEFSLLSSVAMIRANQKISINSFIYHLLSSNKGQKEISRSIAGQAITRITLTKIRNFKFVIPNSIPEQTKIANFLTAVDKRINLLQKKKAELEQYKKGVMQKIFAYGEKSITNDSITNDELGENRNSSFVIRNFIRFKQDDGSDFPDWEEKKLGEVAEIKMGQSPDSKSYNLTGEGLPLIQGNADITDRFSNPRQWTTQSTKTCEIGDLILTVRAPVGSISKSKHKACIGRGVCSIKNRNNSSLEFIYQFLLWYEPKWIRLEQGSTFTAVSGKDIQNLKFAFPTSLDEQQKIANFLSSIDKSIEKVGNQITNMQQWKKGLLQKMFV